MYNYVQINVQYIGSQSRTAEYNFGEVNYFQHIFYWVGYMIETKLCKVFIVRVTY